MSTTRIMAWVMLALTPAGLAGIYFFGLRSLWVILTCIVSCVVTEALWQKCTQQKISVSDLSAAVTGLLLAYNVPPSIPLWMAMIGCVFAMVIVKHFFGGLGQNIINPALAGRAMMLICWPVAMTTWTLHKISTTTPLAILKSVESSGAALSSMNGISTTTPLAILKGVESSGAALPSILDAFVGNIGGCIGETSALALIFGGCLLIYKGIISWKIPVTYIATVAVLSLILGRPGGPLFEIMTGGLMLGAFFMATDYATSPMTSKGQIIFALGCGVITSLIRTFGGYPEGVSYSILIMNLTVPIIDRMTMPRVFGEVKTHGSK
jgi:electron transport complex protein RnfD